MLLHIFFIHVFRLLYVSFFYCRKDQSYRIYTFFYFKYFTDPGLLKIRQLSTPCRCGLTSLKNLYKNTRGTILSRAGGGGGDFCQSAGDFSTIALLAVLRRILSYQYRESLALQHHTKVRFCPFGRYILFRFLCFVLFCFLCLARSFKHLPQVCFVLL